MSNKTVVHINNENVVTIELDSACLKTLSNRVFKGTHIEGNVSCDDVAYLIQGFMSTLVNFDQELPYGKVAFDKGVYLGTNAIKSINQTP